MFGLVGSGRSELLETLFGLHQRASGEIRLAGRRVHLRSAREAARAGIALVPEERQRQGLFFNLSIRHNLVMPRRIVRGDLRIRGGDERREAAGLVQEWRIRAAGIDVPPDSLSGGNQQKVVVAKWLATAPRVLLLDEPTKGVDVGAKFEIHEMIRRQAEAGLACLVVSSDLRRLDGARDALNKAPGIRIVEVYDIKEDVVRAAEIIATGARRYPDLGASVSVGGWPLFTRNALAAIDSAKTKVVSFDTVASALDLMREGKVQVLIG